MVNLKYFPDVIYVTRGTKNPKLIVDNNVFTVNTKGRHFTRWRCSSYFKTKCSATLGTSGDMVRVKGCHNHPPVSSTLSLSDCYPQVVTINRENIKNQLMKC